ncbi:MAG TPA: DUF4395 domain-containing protein [Bacteroidia bacterium]|jgi:uncharacterized YccA/Bax inhibitor family protein|nr:DUF4395 domain-containing protein [Bacteroidia bacterium]
MSTTTIICPVSSEKINENVARVGALITIAITAAGVYFNWPLLLVALAVDFYLRAFTKGTFSPVKGLSKSIVAFLGLTQKKSDAAPKKFAAGIGLFFTASIAILQAFQYTIAADALAGILIFFAALEGVFGFCFGCIIYTYLVLPFLQNSNSESISINL